RLQKWKWLAVSLQRQDPQIITRFRISPSIEEEFAVRRPTAGKQGSVGLKQRLILSDAARQLLIKLMGPGSIVRPTDAIPVVRPDRKRIIGRVEGSGATLCHASGQSRRGLVAESWRPSALPLLASHQAPASDDSDMVPWRR